MVDDNFTEAKINIPREVEGITMGIGITSVLFNGILLLVMAKNSRQIFASLGSYFIANMAIADFITGLNSICWGMNGFYPFNTVAKNAFLTVFWITVQVSFFTIFVMSTERLVAIVFPFRATRLMSKAKTRVYCALVWIISVACGVVMNINPKWYNQFTLIVVFEIVILVIVVEYVFVFRQLRALWLHSKTRAVYTHDAGEVGTPSKADADVQREYQVTVVVVMLAVILILTVFPYTIATQIYLGCANFSVSCANLDGLQKFMWIYFPIELLNFVLNPVVYAWRLPKYRNAFTATFHLKKKSKDGRLICSSNGSQKTAKSTFPDDKQMALLDHRPSREDALVSTHLTGQDHAEVLS